MKPFLTFVLLVTLGLSSCQHNGKPNQKELLSTIEKFNKAFAQGDLATLDSLTTANYLHTNSNSKVIGKTDWFNYLKKRSVSLESGEITISRYELDQTKIEYHGASAIVTGRVTVVVRDSLGTKENQYRITNLWVYEDGIWKRAGFHDGKIQ